MEIDSCCDRGIHILKRYPRDSYPSHYMAMDIRKWNKDLPNLPQDGVLVAVHFYNKGTCDLFMVIEGIGTFLLETPYYRLMPAKVDDEDKQIDFHSLLNGMGYYHCPKTERYLFTISKPAIGSMGIEMEQLSLKAIGMIKGMTRSLTPEDYHQIKMNFNKLLEASW